MSKGFSYGSSRDDSLEERILFAMRRSETYGFLSAAFNQLPDMQLAKNLQNMKEDDILSSFAVEGELSQEMIEGLELIQNYINQSIQKQLEDIKTELAVDRTRLVRGIKQGYGPPPPYESIYIGSDRKPETNVYVELGEVYSSAKTAVPEEVKESPDFIGIELEFMRHLAQREAQAWEASQTKEAIDVLEKQNNFLQEHIALWIPRFCTLMLKEAKTDFYRGIALLTKSFVLYEAEMVPEYMDWVCASDSLS